MNTVNTPDCGIKVDDGVGVGVGVGDGDGVIMEEVSDGVGVMDGVGYM